MCMNWTFSIDDTDGSGEVVSEFSSDDLERTKVAAYEAMCAVFDGPVPEVEEDDKQYVPPPVWREESGGFIWDVYGDQTFIVRVFRAGSKPTTLADLTAELNAYLESKGIPRRCADDILAIYKKIDADMHDWLDDFCKRRDTVLETKSISVIRAKFPKLEEISTGGGCTALCHPCDDGGHILLTDFDASVPTDTDTLICCGVYDADDWSAVESADVHIDELEAWLTTKLAERRSR